MTSLSLRKFAFIFAITWLTATAQAQSQQPSPEAKRRYIQASNLLEAATSKPEKEKALEVLRAVTMIAPEFVEPHLDMLRCQKELGKPATLFIEQYEAYVKEHPQSAVFHYLLGNVLSEANKGEQGVNEYAKALALDPQNGWALFELGYIELRRGNRDRAKDLLEKASKNAGEHLRIREWVARTFLIDKQDRRALEEAEQVLKIDRTYFDVYPIAWQAKMNLGSGSVETRASLRREIRSLERRFSKNVDALLILEKGYGTIEDQEGVDRVRSAILTIDPTRLRGWRFNNVEETERRIAVILKRDPTRQLTGAWTGLAKVYLTKKIKLDKALVYADRTIEFWREKSLAAEYTREYLADALVLRGEILLEKGQTDIAVTALDEAVRLQPQYKAGPLEEPALEEYQLKLAKAYIRAGNKERAINALMSVYAFEGTHQLEAKAMLESLSNESKLAAMLTAAVENRRAGQRPKARTKALNEMAKIEIKPAPDFTLSTLAGNQVRLSDLQGKVVLVNFWATWCGPCLKEYPILVKFENDYKDKGVEIVMVNTDTERYKVPPFLQKHRLTKTIVLADNEVEAKFGIRSVPNSVFIDRNGRIRLQKSGFGPGDELTLREVIEILLNDEKKAGSL